MKTVHVTSSNIKSVRYYPHKKVMRVNFKNNTSYTYDPVTKGAYEALIKAESVGKHFNECFKKNETLTCKKL